MGHQLRYGMCVKLCCATSCGLGVAGVRSVVAGRASMLLSSSSMSLANMPDSWE